MTMWFDRRPGDVVMTAPDEAGGAIAIFADEFDRVRQPADIGGRELKVTGRFRGPCPLCKEEVRIIELEDDYGVIECPTDKFVWYKRRPAAAPEESP